VNHDGSVTLADYTLMTMVLDGYKPLDYNIFDVNVNGVVSFADSATVYDYAWYGSNNSSASVANYGDLRPANADITSVYEGITYLKKSCATGAISEYTLTTAGDTAASTASVEWSTPMEVDSGEMAVVKITKTDGNLIGTGTIIDDHIIATAAHCVYDYETAQFKDVNVRIVNTGYTEIASYTPSYIHIPKQYSTTESYANDYALIYVDQNLTQYGKFEVGLALDWFVTDTTGECSVKVSGFPAEKSSQYDSTLPSDQQYISQIRRYVSEGNVRGEDNVFTNTNISLPDIFNYNTETLRGDSGGPAYIEETYNLNGTEYSCKTMIGIHVGGLHYEPFDYGWSRRITADQLYFYRSNTNLN
jgi:V8-like Glu-specific endopeptidase